MIFRLLFLLASAPAAIMVAGNSLTKTLTIGTEHLKLDFSHLFGFDAWSDLLSEAEMDFRYFVAHDSDSNKKLDGFELFTALEHDRKVKGGEPLTVQDIEKDVEALLLEYDKDRDGYIDYKEFLTIHKTHPDINGERKLKKELNTEL